ncbi:PHB depolymerase family esterase [Roseomonas sp. KE2513]|uniref:alpha/beta hydrolase n=1 Tax=Roseomonas sp. KE2513 TaxID=2479202 RepID=UPI0018DF2E88|nr:PHB depolymerase family esterase [Roseomonas sp. KE2513]
MRDAIGAEAAQGRLLSRPEAARDLGGPGRRALGLATGRDGILQVPEGASGPLPLVVMLHGAGGNAAGTLGLIEAAAPGSILLLPESRGPTWDVIMGGYGPDVAFLDRALEGVFRQHRVDPGRIALAGFSDGASYALSLAIGNGDLFTHAIAFSPGFAAPPEPVGRPLIFASHGISDAVLPIDRCSRRLVPRLRRAGYEVRYREFAGGHHVPPAIAEEALGMLAG